MIFFLLINNIFCSFNEFFPNIIITSIKYHNEYLNIISSNFYLVDSTFLSMNSGAIYFSTTSNYYILIENSMFYNCYCSSHYGGAIKLDCSYSSCALNRICADNCYADNQYGQFYSILNSNIKKNYLILTSISKCSPSMINNRRTSVDFRGGIQEIKSINSSFNEKYLLFNF